MYNCKHVKLEVTFSKCTFYCNFSFGSNLPFTVFVTDEE